MRKFLLLIFLSLMGIFYVFSSYLWMKRAPLPSVFVSIPYSWEMSLNAGKFPMPGFFITNYIKNMPYDEFMRRSEAHDVDIFFLSDLMIFLNERSESFAEIMEITNYLVASCKLDPEKINEKGQNLDSYLRSKSLEAYDVIRDELESKGCKKQ